MPETPRIFGIRIKMAAVIAVATTALFALSMAWSWQMQMGQARDQALEKASVLADEMEAVWAYNENIQDFVNRNDDGTFRSKQLVCVVAAKAVSALFTQSTDYTIRFTRPDPRQVSNTPDAFELAALEAFETDPELENYHGVEASPNGDVFRFVQPLLVDETCLECHGDPVGELDQYGYPKEGMHVGEVAGAMSITEPMQIYYSSARANMMQQLAVMFIAIVLLLCCLYAVASKVVLKPLEHMIGTAASVAGGDFGMRFSLPRPRPRDEVDMLGEELDEMAGQLRVLYTDLEGQVNAKTEELVRLNGELREQGAKLEDALDRLGHEMSYKNEFFAVASHDLRTPLTSIIAYTDMLGPEVSSDEKAADAVGEIAANAHVLLSMVNNMLTISKIEAQKSEPALEPVDMVDLVGLVSHSLAPLAARKDIELNTSVEAGVPIIKGDWEMLRRILENLVNNSIKYTRSDGHILIDVRMGADGEHMEMSVTDDGSGIDSADLSGIFDRYRQSGTSKKRCKGTGLGLAVVKELTALMGGDVGVQSELGQGSTFTVVLPYVAIDEVGEQ